MGDGHADTDAEAIVGPGFVGHQLQQLVAREDIEAKRKEFKTNGKITDAVFVATTTIGDGGSICMADAASTVAAGASGV